METHYVTLCRGPSVVEPISFLMHYVSLLSKAARKAIPPHLQGYHGIRDVLKEWLEKH